MHHKSERFLIWGAGGHGKVVADLVRACGHEVAGYADADLASMGRVAEPGGACVILHQEELLRRLTDEAGLPGADALALAIGSNTQRLNLAQRAAAIPAPVLIHPSAMVSRSAFIERATVVFPRAVVNADARIGVASILNTGAIIEHDCTLGDGVHISPGAVLAGGVCVGDRSWIGAGAVVIQGIAIGSDVIVGAGAVVLRSVPDGNTVVGNPARAIRGTEAD